MAISKYVYQGDDGQSITANLTHLDGTPINLTNATSVHFVMDGALGPVSAQATVSSAVNGQVTYLLDGSDVSEPGDFPFVFQVGFAGGTVTYPTGGPMIMRVLPSLDAIAPDLFMTPSEVRLKVGKTATYNDILQAQIKVSIFLDRDLSDADFLADVGARDLNRLKMAVASESAAINEGNTGAVLGVPQAPAGVTSITQGDVSISYSATSDTDGVTATMSALTLRILSKLSWRNTRTLRPVSMFEDHTRVFTDQTAFFNPVVRPPLWDQGWDHPYTTL